MNKKFLLFAAAAIVLVFGFLQATKPKPKTSNNGSSSTQTNHVKGAGTTGVTLLEYGDYQCAYCQQFQPLVKQVLETYGDRIKFQFKHFPLEQAHKNARAAARAAEAASLQNKFWEMHDLLYDNNDPNGQSGWVASDNAVTYFEQFAQKLGLNMDQYRKDFASSKVNDLINEDSAGGTELGITGTPTFFLDGKKLDPSPTTLDSFKTAIDAAIAAKAK